MFKNYQNSKISVILYMKCLYCKKEHDYKVSVASIINGTIGNERIFESKLCKECFEVFGAVNLSINSNVSYSVNKITQKSIEKLCYENNLKIDQFVSSAVAAEMLNTDRKTFLETFVKSGRLKVFKCLRGINKNGTEDWTYYIIKREVEKFVALRKYGHFILRCSRNDLIKKEFKEKWPYFTVYKGKEYLFVNDKKRVKPCSCCLKILPFEAFVTSIAMKDGISHTCKECAKKAEILRYEKLDEIKKKRHINMVRLWQRQNKDKIKKYKRAARNLLVTTIRKRLANVLKKALRGLNGKKPDYTYAQAKVAIKEIGCTPEELVMHIEAKFVDGMSWDNYGPGYALDEKGQPKYDEKGNTIPIKQWHLDHIRPIKNFDVTKVDELKKINHYCNLQPLWSTDNLKKSGKYDIIDIKEET